MVPEVRVMSVPTAAALVCMGHQPIRVITRPGQQKALIVFAGSARADYDRYNAEKQRIDLLVEETERAAVQP